MLEKRNDEYLFLPDLLLLSVEVRDNVVVVVCDCNDSSLCSLPQATSHSMCKLFAVQSTDFLLSVSGTIDKKVSICKIWMMMMSDRSEEIQFLD
ncbi:hypothetical protein AB6A40_008085 [Gnathostoma spinigerum]|uniref:Uncharacterized protein n=1 Tax=Gnathostoma spinigerum TaxID=75299 RepID=A0ABD6EQ17_9BILA